MLVMNQENLLYFLGKKIPVLPVAGAILDGIGLGWLFFFCRQRRKRRLAAQTALTAETESKDLTTSLSSKSFLLLLRLNSPEASLLIPPRQLSLGKPALISEFKSLATLNSKKLLKISTVLENLEMVALELSTV